MTFNMSWKIGALMNAYHQKLEELGSDIIISLQQEEELEETYAKAIELTCKKGFEFIMPIDMAITWVEGFLITDYDGSGELLDENGEGIDGMWCDVDFLKKAKEKGACFVAWCNK